jgi:hypothetical protein
LHPSEGLSLCTSLLREDISNILVPPSDKKWTSKFDGPWILHLSFIRENTQKSKDISKLMGGAIKDHQKFDGRLLGHPPQRENKADIKFDRSLDFAPLLYKRESKKSKDLSNFDGGANQGPSKI